MRRWLLGLTGIGLLALLVLAVYLPRMPGRLPNMHGMTLAQRDAAFIHFMVPLVDEVNVNVAQQRERLEDIQRYLQHHTQLSALQEGWLQQIASEYQVKPFDFKRHIDMHRLLTRVDIVPVSLALAQSINESAWGRSRFAREGNNFFGQWCFTENCGIVPEHRPTGDTYEVAKFASPLDAVRAYVHNINTNDAYAQLRLIRADFRAQGKSLTGSALANGLVNYSQRGAAYVHIIQGIIRDYHLARYR